MAETLGSAMVNLFCGLIEPYEFPGCGLPEARPPYGPIAVLKRQGRRYNGFCSRV